MAQEAPKRLVVVFGATGAQGSSVAKELLKDGTFAVRATTKNTESDAAKELTEKGAQVVRCDQWNEEELREAMKGAYGVFAVTNFWDPNTKGKEKELGDKVAKVAKEVGVEHYLWSTLPDVEKICNNKYIVAHFTQKANVDDTVRAQGFKYHTFIAAGFYYNNVIRIPDLVTEENGVVTFNFPIREDDILPMYDTDDTGLAALAALKAPEEWNDKYIALVGTNEPFKIVIEQFEKVTGKLAKHNSVPLEEVKKMSEEFEQMYGYFQEFGYFCGWDVTTGTKATGHLTTWEEWLRRSGWTGPIEKEE